MQHFIDPNNSWQKAQPCLRPAKMAGTIQAVIAAATICALCLFMLAGCASNVASGGAAAGEGVQGTQGAQAALPSITVSAVSDISVVPDKAKIGIAVTTQASTAQATQEQNAAGVNAVTEALTALGIAEASIQTTDTWLSPRYDYNNPVIYNDIDLAVEDVEDVSDSTDESTNIVGYEMTTRLSVSDLEIDQVGEVLQACVAAGATNSDGIQYYSSEYDAKYAEALAAAVGSAREKAEVLAGAAGVNLGGVASIVEGYQNTAYRYDTGITMEAAEDEASSMKVSPGEIDIEASVTVTYEIL